MMEKEDYFERATYLVNKASDTLKEEGATLLEYGEVFGTLWITYCVSMNFDKDELSEMFDDMLEVTIKEIHRVRKENKNVNHNATRMGRWKFSS